MMARSPASSPLQRAKELSVVHDASLYNAEADADAFTKTAQEPKLSSNDDLSGG